MNLIISGEITEDLRNQVVRLTTPHQVSQLHANAYRLTDVDTTLSSRQRVSALCDSACVDHAYIAPDTQFSKLRLLVLDMDSTLITIECIDELADYAGKKAEVAAITDATMRGEIPNFAESLRRRVAMLAGIDADTMQRVFDERLRLSKGAIELLEKARNAFIHTLLVSGGFDYFSDRLKTALSLNAAHANTLEVINGKITGVLRGPLIDAAKKAEIVSRTMTELSTDSNAAMVIGDGANDVAMMRCVAHSVAYHAKPYVREIASSAVVYGDLTTVLDFYSDV